MGISDLIAEFITELLHESGGNTQLQRAQLASRFACAPSQINYVLATRFSPERGYVVVSRRGEGGYIHIRRVEVGPERLIMHTVNAIGEEIDPQSVQAFLQNLLDAGALSHSTARIMAAALGDAALRPAPPQVKNKIRASIFKQMLLNP